MSLVNPDFNNIFDYDKIKILFNPFTLKTNRVRGRVNTTFNNISVILWRSVLLVEETTVPVENHQPAASHSQILSHNVVWSTPRHEWYSNSQLQW
jgi:hypothetical protein